MSITSIFGTWQISTVSDNNPPIQKLGQDIPISAYLSGCEGEEFIIRQSSVENSTIEEILITYRSNNHQITRAYQLGKWNIEKYSNITVGAIIVGTSSSSDSSSASSLTSSNPTICRSFIILRYGTLFGVQSSERISLNSDGSCVVIEIELSFAGVQTTLVKYLRRKTTYEAAPLKHFAQTSGWLNESYRNSEILRATSIKFVKAYEVLSPSAIDHGDPESHTREVSLTRRVGDQITDGASVIVFLYEVKCHEKKWYVVHRYKEFDAIRLFITNRKKPLPAKYWKDSGPEPAFPKKFAFKYNATSKAMLTRSQGLQAYMSYHVSRGGHDIPAIIDTLCSFLEIPEHLYEPNMMKNKAKANVSSTLTVSTVSDHISIATAPMISSASSISSTTTSVPFNTSISKLGLSSNKKTSSRASSRRASDSMVPTSVYEEPSFYNNFPALSTIIPIPYDAEGNLKAPKDALFIALSAGMIVIKHGRQGRPQRRLLRTDAEATRIYWQDEPSGKQITTARNDKKLALSYPDSTRSIYFTDIHSIRRGTEYDYTTPDGRREIGTITLRKNKIPLNELELCFSLMVTGRTVDLQCLTKADFDFLYCNFRRMLDDVNRESDDESQLEG